MNVVNWFEIPVLDMARAVAFYNQVFGWNMKAMNLGELDMAWFPSEEGSTGSSGSLIYSPENYQPSTKGTLVYLSVENIDDVVSKIEDAGGSLLLPKTQISKEHGFRAVLLDSEGNRIAIHSKS